MKTTEIEEQSQEITLSSETRRDLFVAANHHIVAKHTAALDQMRQEDTMRDLLALLGTRNAIDALASTQPK